MFDKLLEAIFGIGDGTSWLNLDNRMRGHLRFWGAVSVMVLVVLIGSSLYFYAEWTPLKGLIDSLWGDVQKSLQTTGDIPKWVPWAGATWFAVLTVLSLMFFYFLIDFGKMHYKIDSITCRVIPKVQGYIRFALLENLGCPTIPPARCASSGLASS